MLICTPPTVPVTGFAQSFIDDKRLTAAPITWLETQTRFKTDTSGQFQFCALPNQKITLVLNTSGYSSLQTSTVIVPASGLQSPYDNITFQAPRIATYDTLKLLITKQRNTSMNNNDCQVVTTVTKYHKTLQDDPQGMPGATILLTQNGRPVPLTVKPFYFGIFKNGKTDPFSGKLISTSLDGGVALLNITPNNMPYTLTAQKIGYSFTSSSFICRKGQLINISPPLGPSVINKKPRNSRPIELTC